MNDSTAKIEVALSEHMLYVRITGLATMHNCATLSEFCRNMLDRGYEEAVFDMKTCTGMDSTFMGMMAGLAVHYRHLSEPVVVVVNADEHCCHLMDGLGISALVDVRLEPIDIPDVETHEICDAWESDEEKIEFITEAHRTLVKIDKRNKERFGQFLEAFAKPKGAKTVKFAMCNEFCQDWDIGKVFKLAADTGFGGVEIAPFTLAPDVNDISVERRREIKQQAADAGVEVVGLHWLLVSPEGLYVNHPDKAIRDKTADYFKALIHCCADMGGNKMVIGSPKQRNVMEGLTYQQAWDYARDVFISLLDDAEERLVDLCIEPLTTNETDFITTAAEGVKLCHEISHPRFQLHLDVKAMCGEGRPLDDIIKESEGYVGHFHANDANRSYPGSGDTDYAPVVEALRAIGYDGWVSVEVFNFEPTPEEIATESIKYLSKMFGV